MQEQPAAAPASMYADHVKLYFTIVICTLGEAGLKGRQWPECDAGSQVRMWA